MTIPLTPASGAGQCIDPTLLQPADIIVSTTNAAVSRTIRSATGSVVSHAIIYAGNNRVIEAVGEGVLHRSIDQALHDASLAVGYRHIHMTPAAAQAVLSFARQQVGSGYDYGGIAGQAGYQLDRWFLCTVLSVRNCDEVAARANLWMQGDKRFFCSELVAEAYRRAGVPLVSTPPERVSPDSIVQVVSNGQLTYLGHLKG